MVNKEIYKSECIVAKFCFIVGLTLFLQIGKEVQKVQYQGEISIPALNMLFLEKFSYSLGQNDFPKIYIRDPSIGVSYELVDLSEVKNKSVLSFNINGKFYI